jgi:hypothetical protein
MRSSGATEWWKNIALLACSVALSLIVAEGLAAKFFPQNLGTWGMTRDGMTSHVPNVSVYLPKFKQQITINSFGMRDREHVLKKPPQTLRILVLGDSFMEANQVAFEDSFASLLEKNLRSRTSRDIEVINASVSGWGTDDELTYLTRYGFQFEPDIVMVGMTLHNDVRDNLAEEFHSFDGSELYEKPIGYIANLDWTLLQAKEFLASHVHLYQVFLQVYKGGWVKSEASGLNDHLLGLVRDDRDQRISRGWGMTQQLFQKMKAKNEEMGAQTVVFLIPLWIQVSERKLVEFLKAHQTSKDQIALNRPQKEIKRIGAQEGILIIDLLEAFSDKE